MGAELEQSGGWEHRTLKPTAVSSQWYGGSLVKAKAQGLVSQGDLDRRTPVLESSPGNWGDSLQEWMGVNSE